MSRPIEASSHLWKTASLPVTVEDKLVQAVKALTKDAPMVGVSRLDGPGQAAWERFVDQMRGLGFDIQTKEAKPAWDFMVWPLLSAMKRGIEEHLDEYVREQAKGLQAIELESVFRVWAAETAKLLERKVEAIPGIGSVQVKAEVDDEEVRFVIPNFPDQPDEWWITTERWIEDQVEALARQHDLRFHYYGVDYQNGAFSSHVTFAPDR